MVAKLHRKIIKSRTPFANAIIAAYVIWIGDLLCVIGDVYWLIGDAKIQYHPHHLVVGITLGIAFIVILVSGVWLYISIHLFLKKKELTLWRSSRTAQFHTVDEQVDTKDLDRAHEHLRFFHHVGE